MNAIQQAINHMGGVGKLADAIGVGQSAISNLAMRGGMPSPANCVAIEQVTNRTVTRKDLRPKDWHLIWPELADQSDETVPASAATQ